MFDDPIVEEVREVRRKLSETHGHDAHRMFESLRQREAESERPVYRPARNDKDAATER